MLDIQRELERLERQRDTLDRAIARLRQAARWLRGADLPGAAAGVSVLALPQSLTNVCRAALRSSSRGLTPREVKQSLAANGFDWTRFTNPMSAVHTVLKRLVRQDEAAAVIDEDGAKRFVWLRPSVAAGTPTQAEEAARIEHLLDGVIDLKGRIRRARRPAGQARPHARKKAASAGGRRSG